MQFGKWSKPNPSFSGKIIAKDSDLSFGILGTDNAWNSYIDLLFPLIDKEKSILFIEPNLSMTAKSLFESSSNQSSIGVGYRKLSTNLKSIFGINIFYDVKNNQLGNNFQQIGIGFEYFVSLFSIKANGYIPISKDEYFILDYLIEQNVSNYVNSPPISGSSSVFLNMDNFKELKLPTQNKTLKAFMLFILEKMTSWKTENMQFLTLMLILSKCR